MHTYYKCTCTVYLRLLSIVLKVRLNGSNVHHAGNNTRNTVHAQLLGLQFFVHHVPRTVRMHYRHLFFKVALKGLNATNTVANFPRKHRRGKLENVRIALYCLYQ